MVRTWVAFLGKNEPGYFMDEKAVFQQLASKTIQELSYLGQGAKQPMDLEQTARILKAMVAFTAKHADRTDEPFARAISYCYGVMDATLRDLQDECKKYPWARKVLRQFKDLLPFTKELRDRGILERHPEEKRRLRAATEREKKGDKIATSALVAMCGTSETIFYASGRSNEETLPPPPLELKLQTSW
jgi:hypothetical protein